MSKTSNKAVKNLLQAFDEKESPKSYEGCNCLITDLPNECSSLLNSRKFAAPADISIEEAKIRVATRFLIRKTKRFYDYPPSRQPQQEKSRIKTLMHTLKNSVRHTLTKSLPKTKTISKMTNTLVSTFKGQSMPECLRYLGLSTSLTESQTGVKRKRDFEEDAYMQNRSVRNNNANVETQESIIDDDKFAKPKIYECGYCNASFYNLSAYFKHIRRHKQFFRCDGCKRPFAYLISKRRHELMCLKRAIL